MLKDVASTNHCNSLTAFFSIIGKEHKENLSVKGKRKGKFTCTTN